MRRELRSERFDGGKRTGRMNLKWEEEGGADTRVGDGMELRSA